MWQKRKLPSGSCFTAKSTRVTHRPPSQELMHVCHFAPLCRGFSLSAPEWNKISLTSSIHNAHKDIGDSTVSSSYRKQPSCLTGKWLTCYDRILSSVQLSWAKVPSTWHGRANTGQRAEFWACLLVELLAEWHWASLLASISSYVTWNNNIELLYGSWVDSDQYPLVQRVLFQLYLLM